MQRLPALIRIALRRFHRRSQTESGPSYQLVRFCRTRGRSFSNLRLANVSTAQRAMHEISLRILSWNVHGLAWPLSKDPRGRMDRVCAKVRELRPDLVLLQEVWLSSYVERLTISLRPDWTPISGLRRSGSPKGGLLTFVREASGWRPCSPPTFHAFAASAPAWKIWEGDGVGGKGALIVELGRRE